MPVRLLNSMESRGFYEDIIISVCQYCGKEIERIDWDGQIPSSIEYSVDCDLENHERYCKDNPSNERICSICNHYYDFAGDEPDCMMDDEHFKDASAKTCDNFEFSN